MDIVNRGFGGPAKAELRSEICPADWSVAPNFFQIDSRNSNYSDGPKPLNTEKDTNKNVEHRRLANLVRQQLASLSRFGVTDLPRTKGRLVLDGLDSRLDQIQELPGVAKQPAAGGPSRDSDQQNGLQETVGSPQPTTASKSQSGHLIAEAKPGFHAEDSKVTGSILTTAYPDSLNDTDRKRELEVLSGQVSDCVRCEELSRCRTQTVFGVGSHRPDSVSSVRGREPKKIVRDCRLSGLPVNFWTRLSALATCNVRTSIF